MRNCPDCQSLTSRIERLTTERDSANDDAEKWNSLALWLADRVAENTEHNAAYWIDLGLESLD